jgi:tryptophan-rich sensory protein
MHRLISLAVFLFLVILTAAVTSRFGGGDWYRALHQPGWNPSAAVMASVWAVSYVLMAVSAWMVWDSRRSLARVALGWWGLQLLLNICWSWVYFGLHRPGWSLAVIGLWLLVVMIVTRVFRSIKQEAASLMMPVAVWLLFILALNFVQWRLNGGGLATILPG